MNIKIVYIFLISVLLLSCSSEKDNSKDLKILKHSIKNQIINIQTALDILETQKGGNQASIPFYELANDLNKILFSTIDTNFTFFDTVILKKKLEQLNVLYLNHFTKSQLDPKTKFLKEDADFILNYKFHYIHYNEDLALNYFFSLSNVLEHHYQNICLFGGASSSCHLGYIIDELGYSIIINQKPDTTHIVFNQNYYHFSNAIKVVSLKSILKGNKTIDYYSQNLTDKNTLQIKTPILDTGSYQLVINIESISSKYFKGTHSYNYKFKIK